MHFIDVEPTRDEETGLLYGYQLRLSPLLSNGTASATLYSEIWHRLRRDNVLSCQIDQSKHVFDASLYYRGIPGAENDTILAAVILNNATVDGFKLRHDDAEDTVTEWLHRMDSLLIELLEHPVFAPQLEALSDQFMTESSRRAASTKLKDILKSYCREQHLLVDITDVDAARAQLKERRRQTFQDDVQAGRIQLECPRYRHSAAN